MLAKMKAKAGSAAAFAKDKAEEHKVAERAALASKKAKDKVSESKAGKKALAAGAAVGGAAATVVANHMTPELREMLDHPERGVEVLRANPMVLFSALSIMRLLRSPSLIMLEAAMGLGMAAAAPKAEAMASKAAGAAGGTAVAEATGGMIGKEQASAAISSMSPEQLAEAAKLIASLKGMR